MAGCSTPIGSYTVTVTGTYGPLTHSVNVALTISGNPCSGSGGGGGGGPPRPV
jgi:hypothetical protein